MARDAHGISHSAVNWRGDLADLTPDELRERADALAWWIANDTVSKRTRAGLLVNPVEDFRAARDAWLERRLDA